MPRWFNKLFKHEVAPLSGAPFVEKCVENPSGARAFLAADQARLGKEIEEMYAAYDERLASLAGRVKTLSEEDLAREMDSIREAQDELRRIVRRFQTALKSTDELNRELDGWSSHPGDGLEVHADHPMVRAELVRSELAARNVEAMRQSFEERQEENAETMEQVAHSAKPDIFEILVHEVDPRMVPDEPSLLAAIREAAREAAKWHGLPQELHSQDAVDQVKQFKDLHAYLKRWDRERGVRRDRSHLWPDISGV